MKKNLILLGISLTPGQINANLGQVTSSEDKLSGNLYVAVTLTPDPTWEKIGQLEKRQK